MAYLEEIPIYKSDMLRAFVCNENIVTYINNANIDDPVDLIGENIFPNPYIPDTQSEVKNYICMDIYVPRVKDMLFKDVQIVVNIFSHKNSSTYKGKSRVDLINIEVDKILNGNFDFGIDKVDLVSVMPYIPNSSFFGKQIIYTVPNFNQRRCKHNEHPL
ncbi:hypothetical protein [Lacrimispora indolis]|uniref:hypothetical protein n=1 Tax=Lacrimispora indolis TaxID=69825 RepID=UPI000406C00A|nr:hypothetical protein [[Clostridium] methoxybenzovorans]